MTTNVSMISRALNALGLMSESEHYRRVEVIEDILDETRAAEKTALAQLERARSQLKDAAFNDGQQGRVISELEGDIAELRSSFNQRLADAVQDYQHDATMWRNSLKRSRDRKKGVGK